ncbi:MAG: SulP family inorganic anion transporter [Gammaproteobacteria bacterium]|nr:SulP family inorganic anion transporter [Gammaproteobacteria bacterium]
MLRSILGNVRGDNLRGDLYGGVTAAVVALPLALAFGVASGAGPVAGVYGAIFVGFFAALFGGTPSQISGPTGPMTVVMAAVLTRYAHEPALAFTVVMLAGLFQIGFGALKLGRYINLMPYPVISGFMSGIGCIIIVLQIAPLLGQTNPPGGPLSAIAAMGEAITHAQSDALIAGLASLAIVFFLPARIGRLVPAPLVALAVGTLLVAWVLGAAPVLGTIPEGLPTPQLPTFGLEALPGMIKSALVLAFLGSLDSLLTSLIADNITQTHHDSDRELIGQGIGNALAGLMGAIPGAGATMRTVVNVRAGGRTPTSGLIHALLLLGVMLGLGRYAAYIPHAVLAGILIKVGIDIIDWDYLGRVRRAPLAGVVFMFVVLLLTVLVDLITAVAVGVVMASLLFVKRMADLQVSGIRTMLEPADDAPLSAEEREVFRRCRGKVLYVNLGGPMSFGAANEMGRRLSAQVSYEVLILDLSDVPFIDSSASLAVEEVIERARGTRHEVLLVGIRPAVERVLGKLGVMKLVDIDMRFSNRLAALEQAAAFVEAAEQDGTTDSAHHGNA